MASRSSFVRLSLVGARVADGCVEVGEECFILGEVWSRVLSAGLKPCVEIAEGNANDGAGFLGDFEGGEFGFFDQFLNVSRFEREVSGDLGWKGIWGASDRLSHGRLDISQVVGEHEVDGAGAMNGTIPDRRDDECADQEEGEIVVHFHGAESAFEMGEFSCEGEGVSGGVHVGIGGFARFPKFTLGGRGEGSIVHGNHQDADLGGRASGDLEAAFVAMDEGLGFLDHPGEHFGIFYARRVGSGRVDFRRHSGEQASGFEELAMGGGFRAGLGVDHQETAVIAHGGHEIGLAGSRVRDSGEAQERLGVMGASDLHAAAGIVPSAFGKQGVLFRGAELVRHGNRFLFGVHVRRDQRGRRRLKGTIAAARPARIVRARIMSGVMARRGLVAGEPLAEGLAELVSPVPFASPGGELRHGIEGGGVAAIRACIDAAQELAMDAILGRAAAIDAGEFYDAVHRNGFFLRLGKWCSGDRQRRELESIELRMALDLDLVELVHLGLLDPGTLEEIHGELGRLNAAGIAIDECGIAENLGITSTVETVLQRWGWIGHDRDRVGC